MVDQVLFEGKSAEGTTGAFDAFSNAHSCVYVVFSSGVTAGTVVIETAHRPDYTGSWSAIATISASSDQVRHVTMIGAYRFIRARIASAIQGGTVSCYAYACP